MAYTPLSSAEIASASTADLEAVRTHFNAHGGSINGNLWLILVYHELNRRARLRRENESEGPHR